MRGVFEQVRRHGGWMGTAIVLAVIGGLLTGYTVPFIAYAVFNCLGAWVYLEHPGPSRPRWHLAVRATTAVLLPVGIIALLASNDGRGTPGEQVGIGSLDSDVRNEAARSSTTRPPSRF